MFEKLKCLDIHGCPSRLGNWFPGRRHSLRSTNRPRRRIVVEAIHLAYLWKSDRAAESISALRQIRPFPASLRMCRRRWSARYQGADRDRRYGEKFAANDLTEWTDEGGSRTSDVDIPRRRLIYSTRANLTSRARFLSARRPNTCKAHTCRRWA